VLRLKVVLCSVMYYCLLSWALINIEIGNIYNIDRQLASLSDCVSYYTASVNCDYYARCSTASMYQSV